MKCRSLPASKIACALLVLALLAACAPTRQTPVATPATASASATLRPVPTALPTLSPPAEPTPTTLPPDPPPSLQEITLRADYDYFRHTLASSELITYTNTASQPFTELLLIVEANRYYGSLSIQSIAVDGQAVDGYTLESNRLTLPLPQPLDPGASLSLSLEYTLLLPEIPAPSDITRPQPYGFTLRQANLVDWYFYLPPYQEESGWLAPEPGYFGEHQVLPLANYRVSLRLPEIGTPLTVAASAPAEQDGDIYSYELPQGRSFALSISPLYEVLTGSLDGIEVYSYCFSYDTYAGQAALDHTLQALALYQELFGALPHKTLSVVQADFLDGMEFDGLYFLSYGFYNLYDGSPAGYLTAISVHETAHQWWYGLVGNNQATEPWLDEALCTYAERLYYERYYPEQLAWWWSFRIDFYEPGGAINRTIYDYPTFRAYRDAVYLNGARFLEALRQQMGDEAFFAALRDYAGLLRGRIATSADFLRIFGAHTDEDLTPILENFLY